MLLSLLIPNSAQAAETKSSPSTSTSSSATDVTADEIGAVSRKQISEANSNPEKFSTADLVEQVKVQIEVDRTARAKKLAEEAAAKAKAEAEAKAKAEAEAKAKAEAEKKAAEQKAAAERAAAAAVAAQSAHRSVSGPEAGTSAPPLYSGGGSKDQWLLDSGIAQSDWGYVDYIVSKESGWNPNAVNAGSGASGLVQALPCGKVAGNCFNPVDNLKWANSYAVGRYGSWAQAYSFWASNHWW